MAGWLLQLTLALQYIHQRHIIHRDLKTQNVFLMDDRSLKLGDFGWALEGADGELRVLPALVERKRIGDLVGRSAQGDHIEQLRRMGDQVTRSFLLLEGNPRFASGFTAFGLADARPGSAEDAVTEEADVIELCCALLVDGQVCTLHVTCSSAFTLRAHCVHTACTLTRAPRRRAAAALQATALLTADGHDAAARAADADAAARAPGRCCQLSATCPPRGAARLDAPRRH